MELFSDEKVKKAEKDILKAADDWTRYVLKNYNYSLNSIEQALLDAVIYYQKLVRGHISVPPKMANSIPKPPNLPSDLYRIILYKNERSKIFLFDDLHKNEESTMRYSDIKTTPVEKGKE